ncbi:molybdopterin molybdotransferase MoeA [Alteraurantiacibacter aquimixticola]|uniref:Molybdopterin molybdenumtransferase n=1 Tax=Alteraurantiacibacter aquimixticola TaxID=2489173 RepID=A0A4T3EZ37_9SPHN|nr:molybdopterin molybdotransferase MoeA [Alteraurantiacibacter aquimixticola]TIX50011.1 molybdopterin molybdotransferase MoeA [Alteraurantiacibacter aquimixticola]
MSDASPPAPPPPLPLEEAQRRLLDSVDALSAETVQLEESAGRCLATDLSSRRTQPAADLSAMDGYALRADDLAGPWQVVGESAAGHPYSGELRAGEAIRISTGAMMPAGGGAVLLQENATREGDAVSLNGEGEPTPRHIRRAGFDFRKGDVLLPRGTGLDAAKIALAISGGHETAEVARQANVAIIDSGDELAAEPGNLAQHQIPASNGAMLAALAAPHAAEIRRLGPVPDRLAALVAAFEAAEDCDVIVTSGGASVGDHDLVRPALEQWGAEIDFWRIAMKPGKPLLVARKGHRVVLGLPGNPVSSYVTAFLFLLPLLRKLGGAGSPLPVRISLPLAESLPAVGKRTEFVRARIENGAVRALSEQDSSALVSLSRAQCLIVRDAGSNAVSAGEMVPVYLLQNGGIA